ncbi:uncharacterized protein LOC130985218 [Salvia miltiorrhiza]|uniref:uncharacterized protein LOC130985218 n=1 Tax=Salvia miltiorrhiza TaxID=226208 RepID=UPI0025ABFB83|nr:uncharacterized protein LOC130985218 [Salvia miltiorrhiza]
MILTSGAYVARLSLSLFPNHTHLSLSLGSYVDRSSSSPNTLISLSRSLCPRPPLPASGAAAPSLSFPELSSLTLSPLSLSLTLPETGQQTPLTRCAAACSSSPATRPPSPTPSSSLIPSVTLSHAHGHGVSRAAARNRSETTTGSPPPLHSLSTTHHLPPPSQNQIRPHQPSLQIRRLPDAAVGFGLDCCCSISGEFHHPLCSGREQLWLCSASGTRTRSGAPAAAAPVTSTPRRSAAPNPDLKIGNSNRTTSFHEYRTTSFLHIVAGAKSAFR